MVDYQDSAILRRLVLEKLDAGRTAIRNATVNKGPALSTMASSGGVKADAAGGVQPHRPIGPHAGGGKRDQSGMRVKGTLAETSAEFTGGSQTQGGRNHSAKSRIHLAYVSTMPTRQGAIRRTPSLVCIEGGKR